MSITIEQLEAKQTELAELIQRFKGQPTRTVFNTAAVSCILHPGERYAGLVLAADGRPSHHLVLLPGDRDDINWAAAKAWAESIGGELPSRREQSLLFANLKGEFEHRWYWSSEVHESNGSYAWSQYFNSGYQYYGGQSFEARARAVRRFPA